MKTFLTSAVMLAALCAIYGNQSEGSNEPFETQALKLAVAWQAEAFRTQPQIETGDANFSNDTRTTTANTKRDTSIENVFESTQELNDQVIRILKLVPSITGDDTELSATPSER